MPVNGLPIMLEIIMNKFLEESSLSSYKIAGNHSRSTLVLRFETTMADTDTGFVSDIYHSTPASSSYRRKAPSHIERDRRRHQHYWQSKPVNNEEPPILLQTGCPTKKNVNDKSTMTAADVPTRQEKDSDRRIETVDSTVMHNNSNVSDNSSNNSRHDKRNYDQLTPKSSPSSKLKRSYLITATNTQQEVGTVAVAHNTADQHASNTTDSDDTPVQTSTHNSGRNDNSTPRKEHRRNKSATLRNSTTSQLNTTNEYNSRDKTSSSSDETSSDEDTVLHHGAHTTSTCSNRNNDYKHLANKFLDHEKLSISDSRQNITKEMKQKITRHDRNNKFLKLMPDRCDERSEYVLGETDDLIVEYNRSTDKIKHFVLKTIEPTTSYQRTRQRQVKERGDETTFLLEEDIGDAVPNLNTALPLLKKWIDRHATTIE